MYEATAIYTKYFFDSFTLSLTIFPSHSLINC